ncbi:hypothetical protein QBC41DRAFT_284629 [Cercophora samala]|uniref:Uncharacterized protein n=1 Tax=Cercophora samala TaxID=330535 RepID=A0AA39Z3P3_9PEZI|nr:hypothetical protein QBC41DRAFT_284629 [Cercophora samala]
MASSSSTQPLYTGPGMVGADDNRLSAEEGEPLHRQPLPVMKQSLFLHSVGRITILAFAVWGLISFLHQAGQLLRPLTRLPSCSCAQQFQSCVEPKGDVYHPETLSPGLTLCDCGSSIDEALSLGCVYDTLATAWMPPHCRDPDLTAEFDLHGLNPDGSWPYFADKEGTVPLSISDVAALGGTQRTFWATRRWHLVHCLFYWQKYWRMRHTGAVMEERYDRLDHVRHCMRLLLNPAPDHSFLIEVPVTMNSSIYAGRADLGNRITNL